MMYYIFREDLVEWTDFISHNMDLEMINDSVDPFLLYFQGSQKSPYLGKLL